jgi:hypothetical protein
MSGDPSVPISVWPVAPDDHRRHDHAPLAGHASAPASAHVAPRRGDVALRSPRLAARIVHTHSEPADVVADVGRDPNPRTATRAAGCRYRPLRNHDKITDLHAMAGWVGLIVLRWPARPSIGILLHLIAHEDVLVLEPIGLRP